MAYPPAQSIANARRAIGTHPATGFCLKNVRTWLGVPPKAPTAASSYDQASKKHPYAGTTLTVPAGAPFMFRHGTGAGHIVLSIGGGQCISTIKLRNGDTTDAVMQMPIAKWLDYGYTPLGWTEDLNGVTIPGLAPAPAPHPNPAPQPGPFPSGFKLAPTISLAQRSRGQHVVNFQQIGITNYHTGLLKNHGGADGIFGIATDTLAKSIQRFHGLAQDGQVGPKTQAAIYAFTRRNI